MDIQKNVRFTFVYCGLKGVPRCPGRKRTRELDVNVVQHQWRVDQIQASESPVQCSPERVGEDLPFIPVAKAIWLYNRS